MLVPVICVITWLVGQCGVRSERAAVVVRTLLQERALGSYGDIEAGSLAPAFRLRDGVSIHGPGSVLLKAEAANLRGQAVLRQHHQSRNLRNKRGVRALRVGLHICQQRGVGQCFSHHSSSVTSGRGCDKVMSSGARIGLRQGSNSSTHSSQYQFFVLGSCFIAPWYIFFWQRGHTAIAMLPPTDLTGRYLLIACTPQYPA